MDVYYISLGLIVITTMIVGYFWFQADEMLLIAVVWILIVLYSLWKARDTMRERSQLKSIYDHWVTLHGPNPDNWPDLERQDRREYEEWWPELEDEEDP